MEALSAPSVNPKNLKDLLDAVDRIMKTVSDPEGVQKELGNQGFGDVNLADVQALMRTVEDKKKTPAKGVPQPAPQKPVRDVDAGVDWAPKVTDTAPPAASVPPQSVPTAAVKSTKDVPMAPPIEEIDNYIRNLYTEKDIMKIMRTKYGRGFQDAIRERRKILSSNGPVSALPQPSPQAAPQEPAPLNPRLPSTEPTVNQQGVGTEEFDYVEALKFMQGVNLLSGGSVTTPPVQPGAAPFPERFKQWKSAIDTFIKARIPFDGAVIADQMGFFDIANMVRGQGLQAALMQGTTYGSPTMTMPPGYTPQPSTSTTPPTSMAERMRANFEGMMEMAMTYKMLGPIMSSIGAGMGGSGNGNGNTQVAEIMKRFESEKQERAMDALRNEIKSLQTQQQQKGQPDPASTQRIQQLEFELKMLQNQQARDAETERLKMMTDASKNSGNNCEGNV